MKSTIIANNNAFEDKAASPKVRLLIMKAVTIVEGKIPPSKAREFEENHASVKKEPLPPGFITSLLIKNSKAPETYKILTVWESWDSLEKMRSSTQTPKALELFQKMGAAPVLEVYDVVDSAP